MKRCVVRSLLLVGQLVVLCYSCCVHAMLSDGDGEYGGHDGPETPLAVGHDERAFFDDDVEDRRPVRRRRCCCGRTCTFCLGVAAGAAMVGGVVWLTHWGIGQACDQLNKGCGAVQQALNDCVEQGSGLRRQLLCCLRLAPPAAQNCTNDD